MSSFFMPNTFTLTLLGTDTKYKPFNQGNTLSFMHSLLSGVGGQYCYLSEPDNPKSWIDEAGKSSAAKPDEKLTHCLLEGPDTAGTLVYQRIAQGVMECLNATMRGDNIINIAGHSRGAVEAILVAYELDRIQQKIFSDTNNSFTYLQIKNLIPDSDGNSDGWFSKGAKNSLLHALTVFAAGEFNADTEDNKAILAERFKLNIKLLRINILALDPVPGGDWQGITAAKWDDPRFYSLPAIVKEYKQWFMLNERSRSFEGIIPKRHEKNESYVVEPMLGHHGTACGNTGDQNKTSLTKIAKLFDRNEFLTKVDDGASSSVIAQNNKQADGGNGDELDFVDITTALEQPLSNDSTIVEGYQLKEGLTTKDVTTLFLYGLYDFTIQAGASFITQVDQSVFFNRELGDKFWAYHNKSLIERKKTKLSCYQNIADNRLLYEMFDRTCYITGQPGDKRHFWAGLIGGTGKRGDFAREVRAASNSTINHLNFFSKVNSKFINEQHVALYLDVYLGADAKLSEYIVETKSKPASRQALYDLLMTPKRTSNQDLGAQGQEIYTDKERIKTSMVSRMLSLIDDFLVRDENRVSLTELNDILSALNLEVDGDSTEQTGLINDFYKEIRGLFRAELKAHFFNQFMVKIELLNALSQRMFIPNNEPSVSEEKNRQVFNEYFSSTSDLKKLKSNLEALSELLGNNERASDSKQFLIQNIAKIDIALSQAKGSYIQAIRDVKLNLPAFLTLNIESQQACYRELNESFSMLNSLQDQTAALQQQANFFQMLEIELRAQLQAQAVVNNELQDLFSTSTDQHQRVVEDLQGRLNRSEQRVKDLSSQLNTSVQTHQEIVSELQVRLEAMNERHQKATTELEVYKAGLNAPTPPVLERGEIGVQVGSNITESVANGVQTEQLPCQIISCATQTDNVQMPALPVENDCIELSLQNLLSGLTLEILGGFSAVIGVSAVAIALAALTLGSVGALPASIVIVAGTALSATGFFSLKKGIEQKIAESQHSQLYLNHI